MATLQTLALVIGAIGFAIGVAILTIIVGIHQEERSWTLTRDQDAPTGCARLARRVLNARYDRNRFRPLDGPQAPVTGRSADYEPAGFGPR